MRPLSIRWRLTLWYSGVLAALLAMFSAAVFAMMRHHLNERTDEILRGELAEVADSLAGDGTLASVKQQLHNRFASDERFMFEVLAADGNPIFQCNEIIARGRTNTAVRGLAGAVAVSDRDQAFTEGYWPDAGAMRVAYARLPTQWGPVEVRVATRTQLDREELQHLLWIILLAGPLALSGAVAGGYLLARRGFEPVDRMVATAAGLTARQLDHRLTVVNPDDELGRLAQTLNQMIARLEQSFVEMQRFTADAAHELRTPLAIIRNQAEVALRTGRTVEEYRQVLESLLDENDRLSRLADQLLYLCREDAGLQSFRRRPVRVDELLSGVIEHMQVLATEKQISLEPNFLAATVDGDDDRLRRVFYNLLDNAIKYTALKHSSGERPRPSGRIRVECKLVGSEVWVTVSDNGPGIAPEHLSHVFDRFYRIDAARGDAVRGTGLGLAICRAIIESHGGRISIASQPGGDTTVTVVLPKSAGSAVPSQVGLTNGEHAAREFAKDSTR